MQSSWSHGRPHIEANGVSWPPGKIDEKLKSENMQKKSSFLNILRAIRTGICRERRYADHIFIRIYFRMHHFVVKFSKFSSPQAARGHWPPNQNPADPPGWSVTLQSRSQELWHRCADLEFSHFQWPLITELYCDLSRQSRSFLSRHAISIVRVVSIPVSCYLKIALQPFKCWLWPEFHQISTTEFCLTVCILRFLGNRICRPIQLAV